MANSYQQSKASQLLEESNDLSPEKLVSETQALTKQDNLYPAIEYDPAQFAIAFKLLLVLSSSSKSADKKTEEVEPDNETIDVTIRDNSDVEEVLPNYYEVLGVDKNATPEEIKKSYRALIKEHHPDTLGSDATEEELSQANIVTQQINIAHTVLTGKNKEVYDKLLEDNSSYKPPINYGSAGSIIIFHEEDDSAETPKSQSVRKSKIPVGFFDQSRIMRLQNGPEKNLAIAMMLSRKKVSSERFNSIVSLLLRWGKLTGRPIIPDKIDEHLGQIGNHLATLNDQSKKSKDDTDSVFISSVAFINSDQTVTVITPNLKLSNTDADLGRQITQYRSINLVPDFILKKTSTTLDINKQLEMSLSDSNFSFGNNPVFRLFQDQAGSYFKKHAVKELEKAGIKFAGKEAAKIAATTGIRLGARAGLHALAETLNVIPGLGLLASVVLEVGMRLAGKVTGFIKRNSKEIAALGAGLVFLGVAGGSALMTGVGGLAMMTHAVAVGPEAAISGVIGSATAAISALIASTIVAVSSAAVAVGIGGIIFVSLVLFIINNSAFVTPQGNTVRGGYGGGGDINPGPIVSGTCPIEDPKIIYPSYNPPDEVPPSPSDGHGSNHYWGSRVACSWNIPLPQIAGGSCLGPVTSEIPGSEGNACANVAGSCPYYGLAVDVGSSDGTSNPTVSFPSLCDSEVQSCPKLSWDVTDGFYICEGSSNYTPQSCAVAGKEGWGWGVVAIASVENGPDYSIFIGHIDPISSLLNSDGTDIETDGPLYESGETIGIMTEDLGDPSHIHIELAVDGQPVRPDFMCGGASQPPTGECGGTEQVIGTSELGTPITVCKLKNPLTTTVDKEMFVVAGIHMTGGIGGGAEGDNTYKIGQGVIDYFSGHMDEIPEGVQISVVPIVNVDVLNFSEYQTALMDFLQDRGDPEFYNDWSSYLGRFTTEATDPNRNFDNFWWSEDSILGSETCEGCGGTHPYSSSEVSALKSFIDRSSTPYGVIAIHSAVTGGLVVLDDLEYDPSNSDFVRAVAQGVNYPVGSFQTVGYFVGGDLMTWVVNDHTGSSNSCQGTGTCNYCTDTMATDIEFSSHNFSTQYVTKAVLGIKSGMTYLQGVESDCN